MSEKEDESRKERELALVESIASRMSKDQAKTKTALSDDIVNKLTKANITPSPGGEAKLKKPSNRKLPW